MYREELTPLAVRIHKYWGKKIPDSETLDEWHQKVKHIPGGCLGWIAEQINSAEKIPGNIPQAIIGLWGEWLRQHPQQQEYKRGCPDCNGGYIHCEKEGQEFTFRCINCKPTSPAIVPYVSQRMLLSKGYKIWWGHKPNGKPEYLNMNAVKRDARKPVDAWREQAERDIAHVGKVMSQYVQDSEDDEYPF